MSVTVLSFEETARNKIRLALSKLIYIEVNKSLMSDFAHCFEEVRKIMKDGSEKTSDEEAFKQKAE